MLKVSGENATVRRVEIYIPLNFVLELGGSWTRGKSLIFLLFLFVNKGLIGAKKSYTRQISNMYKFIRALESKLNYESDQIILFVKK